MNPKLIAHISTAIRDVTHRAFTLSRSASIGGGSINEACRLEGTDGARYFLKLNDAQHLPMFIAEEEGLTAIAATNTIRVPRPIAHGVLDRQSYLVLEHLELSSHGNARLLGEQLAALHRCTPSPPLLSREITSDLAGVVGQPSRMASSSIRAGGEVGNSQSILCARQAVPACQPERALQVRVDTLPSHTSTPSLTLPLQEGGDSDTSSRFGFDQDNFIGTTPQPNGWKNNWIDFWREQRLGFQLRLAEQNGYGGQLQKLGEKLMDALAAFFENYTPLPSLLHGDLWSGNHAFLADGTPAIFDPATYYGDREADIAMTELFGGYGKDFYAAYRAAYPLDEGYATRKVLYNLYHILNHANLFGGGYASQAEQMMQGLLGGVG